MAGFAPRLAPSENLRHASSNKNSGFAHPQDAFAVNHDFDSGSAWPQRDERGRSVAFPRDASGPTIEFLSGAIDAGDIATIKRLLQSGTDLETTDEFGRTPLWRAVEVDQRSVIQLLLENGCEP